jgi:LEA14-like dessication related protein
VPRLPQVKLHELDAARFSPQEANAMFYVGVVNPNPFTIRISGVSYTLDIGGKRIAEGTIGKGEKIGPAATGVFETQVVVNEESYGPEVAKLIKSLKLPYVMRGELSGELVNEPYELKGEIKLNVSK